MSWAVDELAFDELAVDEMAVNDLTPNRMSWCHSFILVQPWHNGQNIKLAKGGSQFESRQF